MESGKSKTKGEDQKRTMVLSETQSSCYLSKSRQGPDLEGQWPGAITVAESPHEEGGARMKTKKKKIKSKSAICGPKGVMAQRLVLHALF